MFEEIREVKVYILFSAETLSSHRDRTTFTNWIEEMASKFDIPCWLPVSMSVNNADETVAGAIKANQINLLSILNFQLKAKSLKYGRRTSTKTRMPPFQGFRSL